ncbi:MAG: hypothetical protein ABGY96_16025 [bacterium]|nr:hypothetical protein [Gammaproteobacteria bacterium]
MQINKAKRLQSLAGKRIAMLDCGKRGGSEILKAVALVLAEYQQAINYEVKSNAHRIGSRKLIEYLASGYDAIV